MTGPINMYLCYMDKSWNSNNIATWNRSIKKSSKNKSQRAIILDKNLRISKIEAIYRKLLSYISKNFRKSIQKVDGKFILNGINQWSILSKIIIRIRP